MAFGKSERLSKVRLFGLGLGVFLLAVGVLFLRSDFKTTYASGHFGKEIKLIQPHGAKAVCGQPKPGRATCMEQLSTATNGQPLIAKPTSAGSYGPVQFHTAYQLPCEPGGSVQSVCSTPSSYGPETVAIVDAGNYSTGVSGLVTSLQNYDSYYGLPACSDTNGCLSVVSQTGSTTSLPGVTSSGWSDEIALDVEATHMVCQTCKIVLVEANDDSISNLAAAEAEAVTMNPTTISNSWGGNDASQYDTDFKHSGMAIVAATGDNGTVGNGQDWPADIPDVVAASGTTLQINTDNTWASETVWTDSGGGCSTAYSAPSWQTSLSDWSTNGCSNGGKAMGDVSIDGDPNTGAAINMDGSWYEVGGTSLSSPMIAAIYALAGGVPANATASSLPYTLFKISNSHDITSGSDCTASITVDCTASVGFDTPSGLGSPNGIGGFQSLLSPPTSLSFSGATQSQVSLSWVASVSSGVTGYYIYRNGTEVSSTSSLNWTDTGLATNMNYTYYVVAHDGAGNLSGPSVAAGLSTYSPEDINSDGHINLLDLSLLANKYGQSGSGLGRADINGDGQVNLLDLSLLANKYGSE